jgi:ADP-heptose:LPS heptosyltransferase
MSGTQTPERPSPSSNGRLLICNIGRLGDTILSNSILDSAFRTYATVDYLGCNNNAELLQSDYRLNRVIVLRNSLPGFADVLSAALRPRYDGFIGLKDTHSTTNLILARLFRSKVKTGWNGDRFRPFDRDVRSVNAPHLHKVDVMRRIGQLAGLEAGEYKPSLVLAPDSIKWFRRSYVWEKPFIFLNLSATHANRIWPVEHWAAYVRGCGLAEESILVSGVPRDRHMVYQLSQKLPRSVVFQPRKFMDVAAAIADARLVLTVDTGVVHACSALNRPIVAFYCGGSSGIRIGPLSTRRLVIHAPPGRVVREIDPAQAIAETQPWLA